MKDPGILLKTEARYSSRVQQPTRPMAILSSQPHPYWPAQLAASRVGPVPTDQPLVPLARRRTGVKNGCGTARDVVSFLVRSRPRISLTPGTGLPRGRSLSLRARGLDSSARPRFPGRYRLAG